MIFVDMDGVLCDWVTPAIRLCGGDPSTVQWPGVPNRDTNVQGHYGWTDSAFWTMLDSLGADWWEALEPYPWMGQLAAAVGLGHQALILSSPSRSPHACAGKLRWLKRHFGDTFDRYVFTPHKQYCAGKGNILIDDSVIQCTAFSIMGGQAILFPQPWNAVPCSGDPVDTVLAELNRLRSEGI